MGITDYQLGAGAAAGYWKAVMMEIERRAPSNPKDVIELMARVCRHPVSSRLADQKLARVEKVIRAWGSEQVTSQPVETGSSGYGGTTEANNTTRASAGTIVTLPADNWNVRMPYLWLPTPEMRPILGPNARMTFELATTPADAITMSGTLWFEELGG